MHQSLQMEALPSPRVAGAMCKTGPVEGGTTLRGQASVGNSYGRNKHFAH